MKMILAVMMLGLAACGGTEQALPNAAGTWSFSTPRISITMTLEQSQNGGVTGTATKIDTGLQGAVVGDINGPENLHVRMTFSDASVAEIQATGLPARMFGTVYVNSEAIVFEAARD